MVIFKECKIDIEGKNLIIDVQVDNLPYFKDIYMESLIIDSEDTFIDSGPSNHPIYSESLTPKKLNEVVDGVYYNGGENGPKELRRVLNIKDLNIDTLNNHIFFIYIGVSGVPAPSTPCGMDNKYSVAVAVNLKSFYNIAMSCIKELNSTCSISKRFIDMMLRLKAFELSIKTGNFITAIGQWSKFFKDKKAVLPIKECNCNEYR